MVPACLESDENEVKDVTHECCSFFVLREEVQKKGAFEVIMAKLTSRREAK